MYRCVVYHHHLTNPKISFENYCLGQILGLHNNYSMKISHCTVFALLAANHAWALFYLQYVEGLCHFAISQVRPHSQLITSWCRQQMMIQWYPFCMLSNVPWACPECPHFLAVWEEECLVTLARNSCMDTVRMLVEPIYCKATNYDAIMSKRMEPENVFAEQVNPMDNSHPIL